MKDLDLKVLNSNSYEASKTELSLITEQPKPLTSDYRYVVTRGDEIEEFESLGDLQDWFLNECDKELYDFYLGEFGRRSTSSIAEWVDSTFLFSDFQEWLGDKGWKIERVVK